MKRYQLIFALSLLLFVGSLVTTLSVIQERNYELRGYADASVDTNLPFRVPRLGVNAQSFPLQLRTARTNSNADGGCTRHLGASICVLVRS